MGKRTFVLAVFLPYSSVVSVTDRTAVYGPVCTVVWQGSAGDRRPYADLPAPSGLFTRWYDGARYK